MELILNVFDEDTFKDATVDIYEKQQYDCDNANTTAPFKLEKQSS